MSLTPKESAYLNWLEETNFQDSKQQFEQLTASGNKTQAAPDSQPVTSPPSAAPADASEYRYAVACWPFGGIGQMSAKTARWILAGAGIVLALYALVAALTGLIAWMLSSLVR